MRSQKRGAVLVAVLVCLLVVTLIGVGLVRLAIVRFRHTRIQQYQVQAQWLAESALQRALARMRESPDYSGEIWSIAAAELDGLHPAEVRIRVEKVDNLGNVRENANHQRIAVEARFPAGSPEYPRAFEEIILAMPDAGNVP